MSFNRRPLNYIVLVADADEEVRWIIADALDYLRPTIMHAANVYEVFEQVAREGVNLVITDLEMPGGDSAYIGELRRRLPNAPILVLTALDWAASIQKMGDGACGYLKKPFRIRQLRAIVVNLLDEACRNGNAIRRISEPRQDVPTDVG